MKNKLSWIMAAIMMFSAVPPVTAMDLNEKDGMEEVKKKKWKKKKGSKSSNKNNGKKSKKGFWSFFGGG